MLKMQVGRNEGHRRAPVRPPFIQTHAFQRLTALVLQPSYAQEFCIDTDGLFVEELELSEE